MKHVQVSAGRDSEWSVRFRRAENRKLEEIEETEVNGVEEGQEEMSDERGVRIDGEEELAAPDWRVKAGPNREGPSSPWITTSSK